jgi:hypothetical protein
MVLSDTLTKKGQSAGIHVDEGSQMDERAPVSRFLVRQSSNGWFVYDRERKGPANLRTHLAERLTKEQADEIQRRLTAEFDGFSARSN